MTGGSVLLEHCDHQLPRRSYCSQTRRADGLISQLITCVHTGELAVGLGPTARGFGAVEIVVSEQTETSADEARWAARAGAFSAGLRRTLKAS
jgi:hypothetical protein